MSDPDHSLHRPIPADDAVEQELTSLQSADQYHIAAAHALDAIQASENLATPDSFYDKMNTITMELRAKLNDFLVELQTLRSVDHQADITLKGAVGRFAYRAAGIQLVIANLVVVAYVVYSFATASPISTQLITIWFSSVVVEVIGILLVVANYVFPKRGASWSEESTELVKVITDAIPHDDRSRVSSRPDIPSTRNPTAVDTEDRGDKSNR
jgi:hypothetical protein